MATVLALCASTVAVQGGAVVAQVGEAVTQMDQATQQNAALVEEMSAAASSLKGQAQDLVQAVAVFTLAQERSDTHASSRDSALVAWSAPRRPVTASAAERPALAAY